jgi:hypothetical protein
MLKRYALLSLVLLSLTACSNVHCPFKPTGRVDHVVICWLKEPGNEAQRRQIIDRSNDFKKIPGVISVRAGRPIPSTRPVVDSSFDVALVVTFKDEASMRAYDKNPIHVKAVNEVLKPVAGKLVIYDIDTDSSVAREK